MKIFYALDSAGDVSDVWFAQDEGKWCTVKPNGPDAKGRHVLYDNETGIIQAGMGGKYNGIHIDDVPRKHPRVKLRPGPQTKEAALQSAAQRTVEPQTQMHDNGAAASLRVTEQDFDNLNSKDAINAALNRVAGISEEEKNVCGTILNMVSTLKIYSNWMMSHARPVHAAMYRGAARNMQTFACDVINHVFTGEDPDSIAGVEKSAPMTFEQADSGHVNPRHN